MKKNLMLIIPILLFMVSIFLIFAIWKNNYTARTVGFILLLTVNLFNIVRGIERWNEGK